MLGLLGRGRSLADQLGGELVALHGQLDGLTAREITDFGADAVYELGRPSANDLHSEHVANAIGLLAMEKKPYAILFCANRFCKEIAPRVATRLRTGCIAECVGVLVGQDARLIFKRYVYGGNGLATLTCTSDPQIATVSTTAFLVPSEREGTDGRIMNVEVPLTEPAVRIREQKEVKLSVTLEEAEVVVCAGRGFRKKEDLALAEELATVVGGQVGCTRPVAEDLKWYPQERHIGLTGVIVKPRLYLAVGLSGAIQHQMGMRDSNVIVAINNDPKAPIMEVADYGIVADLYDMLPLLTRILRVQLDQDAESGAHQ